MSVIERLASVLGIRSDDPDIRLAEQIVDSNDAHAVAELVDHLKSKNKGIQSDCIKTLYEIGTRNPKMIAPYCEEFVKLLDSKNNRLVWGAMTALDEIAAVNPDHVYSHLTKILSVADSGSVITRDHAVGVLVKLGSTTKYSSKCLPSLLEQLKCAPNNQFPAYAENSLSVIHSKNKDEFLRIFKFRLTKLEKDSQKKRVERVMKKIQAL